MSARWKMEISHYQQYDNDMVTPGVYAPFAGGGFFLDTNGGAGLIDPFGTANNYWLEVNPDEFAGDGLQGLKIEYRLKSAFDNSNPDGTNYIFALTDTITIVGTSLNASVAYNFIKAWLIDDATAPNNSIAVKLTSLDCPDVPIILTDLNINVNQIKWNNVQCLIECDMKEIQPDVSCFERTLIDDNHQGWFEELTTKNHPRFKYCNKVSPILILIMLSIFNSIMWPMLLLETIINQLISAINTGLGTNIDPWTPITSMIGDVFNKLFGCKFEHPAPLVRDYFKNVCDKCLLTYNNTDDLFNSTILSYPLNDGGDPVYGDDNPYYNTVMFYPHANRKGMKTGKNTRRWQQEYTPGFTGFSFAEELKKVFNAEWRIFQSEFCFYKKREGSYINANAIVFDFSQAPDSNLLINNHFDFEWDEVIRAAYMRGIYAESDAYDTNQANTNERWNTIVDFNLNKNPNFKGEKNNTSEYFAATQFRFDNTERDYLLDGIIGVWGALNAALPAIQTQINAIITETPKHAILLEKMQVEKPRLIIWDPALSGDDDFTNSNSYSAFSTITNWGVDPSPFQIGFVPLPDAGGYTNPVPDPYYNGAIGIYPAASYTYDHLPQYGTNYWAEYYVYSFPLHFDEKFLYNMYGNFYKQDDPQFVPPMRVKTTATIKACCETFDRLGINGSGSILLNCKCIVPFELSGTTYEMWIYTIKYDAATQTIELGLHTNKYN